MIQLEKQIVEKIRPLSSSDAADWIIETYDQNSDEFGSAIFCISRRSWRRGDQIKLARHFLQDIPHGSAVHYNVFLSIMSIDRFLNVLQEKLPRTAQNSDLLLYYLRPALQKNCKSEKDVELVQQFIDKL